MSLKYSLQLILLLICVFTVSCKLSTSDDTDPPEIQLTIKGDLKELSRGISLYLDINDDSKIDYVSVMIDDTTAITVESNFDTISFDVTPFADESEHILFVKVADEVGNVGESEILDVVITEFPGWRIYDDKRLNYGDGVSPVVIDTNGQLLIGTGMGPGGFYIFNPTNNNWLQYTSDNSPMSYSSITDIKLIEDGRAWLANNRTAIEFIYGLNQWGRIFNMPINPNNGELEEISSIEVDKNFDLWVGTWYGGLFHYSGHNLVKQYLYPEIPSNEIHDIIIGDDNTLYATTSDVGVFSLKDGIITTYDFFSDIYWELVCVAIDSSGNVYASQGDAGFIFNGNNWENITLPDFGARFFPMLVTNEGLLYTQGWSTGLISWDGLEWTDYQNYDSPFYNYSVQSHLGLHYESIAEAPNGDIWMVAGGKLMRYRPSLGRIS